MRQLYSARAARRLVLAVALVGAGAVAMPAGAGPLLWGGAWPDTDFERTSIDLGEIMDGGPPKDGIPSIDEPQFVPVSDMRDLAPREPVIGLVLGGTAQAYPLRILAWHEIVNDVVGGHPVTITYCPLCNSAIVFDRRVDGRVLDFGTTGKLRRSDMVMYDRQTESWWQQFLGEAIVGELTGTRLRILPARLESWERFAARNPEGEVLVPNDARMRRYGFNPYVDYDTRDRPYFPVPRLPTGIAPLARVVKIGDEAWSLALLRRDGEVTAGDLTLAWEAGQASALDDSWIPDGRDVGNVTARRKTSQGDEEVAYDVTFAFVFASFFPDGTLHK